MSAAESATSLLLDAIAERDKQIDKLERLCDIWQATAKARCAELDDAERRCSWFHGECDRLRRQLVWSLVAGSACAVIAVVGWAL